MSIRQFLYFSIMIKIASGILAVFFTIITIYTVGPSIETKYFPVVSKLTITKTEWRGPEVTRIWAQFNKLRNCEYKGIAWYRGNRNNSERVPIILQRVQGDTSSPNRPMGLQKAGPWDIYVPSYQLQDGSFGELYHQCHPFWLTRTEFFP